MLSWSLILVLIALIALGAFWQQSLPVRERANQAAQDACARMGVQFLDGTVAFAGLRLARNEALRLTLRRTYVFDYTADSIARRHGFVVMLGTRIEHIGFERDGDTTTPHAITRQVTPHVDVTSDSKTHENQVNDGKVLNLADWRRRRAQRGDSATPAGDKHDSNSDNGW